MFEQLINEIRAALKALTESLGSPSTVSAIFLDAEQQRLSHVRERLAALNAEASDLIEKRATLARRMDARNGDGPKSPPPASGAVLAFPRVARAE